ncbi:MAG: metal-dependent transcriptional regulator [Solirubrobacteraceae bacterium]|nr:metal-dependent transcriptional regulator [Solirubrobacteraceae bacterium]
MANTAGHSVDDYLETIYFLAFPVGEYRPADGSPAIAARIAELLGVSRAAAGEMLKRLAAEGLIERGANKEAILTVSGKKRAERVVRRHRIVERFLTDYMGIEPAESHVEADRIGGTFSDDMVDRMNEKLGFPDRCPHGWLVEPKSEQKENDGLIPLADLEAGRSGEIVALAEHDGDLLQWFYSEGLVPGARLHVEGHQAAAGQMKIRIGDREHAIADKAAGGLFVRIIES